MTDPHALPPSALKYFGLIESAVRDRLPTADIWSLIRDQAEAAGLSTPGVSAAEVSQMRGMAAGIRSAAERLADADRAFALDRTMIADAPWARPLGQQEALPLYQVRFAHTTEGEAGEQTAYRSIFIRSALPPTLDDLDELIGDDAEQMAENYGESHVGFGNVSILRV